jgi:hypothetical protein
LVIAGYHWAPFVLPDDGGQVVSGEVVAATEHREWDLPGCGLAL